MKNCRDCDHHKDMHVGEYPYDDHYTKCKKHDFIISNNDTYSASKYTCDDNTEDDKMNKINFRKVR